MMALKFPWYGLDCDWADGVHCKALIYKRDTYRYSGHGSSGFTMHYSKEQCSRLPQLNGYCWQHQKDERYA